LANSRSKTKSPRCSGVGWKWGSGGRPRMIVVQITKSCVCRSGHSAESAAAIKAKRGLSRSVPIPINNRSAVPSPLKSPARGSRSERQLTPPFGGDAQLSVAREVLAGARQKKLPLSPIRRCSETRWRSQAWESGPGTIRLPHVPSYSWRRGRARARWSSARIGWPLASISQVCCATARRTWCGGYVRRRRFIAHADAQSWRKRARCAGYGSVFVYAALTIEPSQHGKIME
jgi:hypothetical protein